MKNIGSNISRKIASVARVHPLLGRLLLRALPDVKWNIQLAPIGTLTIRLRRHRSYWLRSPLMHEGLMLGTFHRLIQPGAVVYDVGSNIGMYVRFFVQCYGAGSVVGFEPMAENLELLRLNVAHEPLVASKTKIMPVALADADGTELLQADDVSSGSATLDRVAPGQASPSRRQYGLPPRTESVTVCRLDSVVEREGLAPPDFIKIDVEGAAAMTLRGALKTLEAHRPDMIVETHGPAESKPALEILQGLGYACYGYVDRGQGQQWSQVSPDDCRSIGDFWQPHFIIASQDATKIEQPIEHDRRWM